MGVRLYDYMTPSMTPSQAFAAAVGDISRRGSGDTLLMPDETVEVGESFTSPVNVAIFIPRGGQIKASGTLTILGRITSESGAPFSGTIQTG